MWGGRTLRRSLFWEETQRDGGGFSYLQNQGVTSMLKVHVCEGLCACACACLHAWRCVSTIAND